MNGRSFGRRALVGIGATTALGIALWLDLKPTARTPEITAPEEANIPPTVFERSLPALRHGMGLAWTADSALLISSASARLGFRVQTITGKILEEYTVPYGDIYHRIISSDQIITQTHLHHGVPFEVVYLRDGRVLLQGIDPAPHNPNSAAGNIRFAIRADRSVVAVGYGPPHSSEPVRFYDTKTWLLLSTLALPTPGPAAFWSLELSGDGEHLAYNTHGAVMIVAVADGTVVQRLPVAFASWFKFSPDNRTLAVAERALGDGHTLALRVYRVSDGRETAHWLQPSKAFVRFIEWDPQGRFLSYINGQDVHLWNTQSDTARDVVIRLRSESVGDLALSPDGRWMAVGDGYSIDLFRIGV